jgi:hypothetical protein
MDRLQIKQASPRSAIPALLGLVIAFLALILSSTFTSAHPVAGLPLDHFKCYQTEGPAVLATVLLEDQFDAAAGIVETAVVGSPARFCNPVQKSHKGQTRIKHEENHLVFYLTNAVPTPPQTVVVSNQFDPATGPQTLQLLNNHVVLAVPTEKQPHGPTTDLDHFKCYRATGQPINDRVGLKDQFHRERVKVLEPFRFCNPVEKNHAGAVTPILRPDDHLVCYVITIRPFTTTVAVTNQFFPGQTLTVFDADRLCVPSQKLHAP